MDLAQVAVVQSRYQERIAVANGKTWEFKPPAVWRQTDGNIYIDCNVAGKVLVTS